MNISLSEDQKKQIKGSRDLYKIMQQVLLRENKISREKEHLWTVSLSGINKILSIELSALGGINKVGIEPKDVFRMALVKGAKSIILVHNHPSGILDPSPQDYDLTDRLIQVGRIIGVDVLDHLIIHEKDYMGMAGTIEWQDLLGSTKYLVNSPVKIKEIKQQLSKELKQKYYSQARTDIIHRMLEEGADIKYISLITGLPENEIEDM